MKVKNEYRISDVPYFKEEKMLDGEFELKSNQLG